jgi:excisionase family DNA binding protein
MHAVLDDRDEQTRLVTRRPALLHTAEGIAEYIGMPLPATRHLIRKGVLPTFRIGRTVCARPDRIDAALDELEQQQRG